MKKILLSVAVLFLSASVMFAARNGGMDLVDIFGKNQLGAGYDGREWDTSLYSDFGTDKLRFSVNLWNIGGSWYNNGDLKSDDSTVPFQNGLPTFFVGAGYKFSDTFRLAVGYGGNLAKYNVATHGEDGKKYSEGGYYGNDVSVFLQANVGANIIRFATPIQFGKGFGHIGNGFTNLAYDMKNVSVFSMKPEIRWIGEAGPLVQIRFAVPFGFGTAKEEKNTAGAVIFDEKKITTVGADLRIYLKFATDPVVVQFVPRIVYNQAIKGNHLSVTGLGGFNSLTDESQALPNTDDYYTADQPWAVRVDLPIDLGASTDMITVWGAPQVRFYAAGSPKAKYNADGRIRKDAFYGIGYALPLELTVRPIANLEFNIGMEVEATTPLMGGAAKADANVDGSIVWFF